MCIQALERQSGSEEDNKLHEAAMDQAFDEVWEETVAPRAWFYGRKRDFVILYMSCDTVHSAYSVHVKISGSSLAQRVSTHSVYSDCFVEPSTRGTAQGSLCCTVCVAG